MYAAAASVGIEGKPNWYVGVGAGFKGGCCACCPCLNNVNDVFIVDEDKKGGSYYPNMSMTFGTKVDKALVEKAVAAKAPMGKMMKREPPGAKV